MVDWGISQYVDLDPTMGILDYRNGEKIVKNGHKGVDFVLPNFRWMGDDISNNVPVFAAADGRVISVQDGHYDRNITCRGLPNRVVVEHSNGLRSKYVHLKEGSIGVSEGQQIVAGQQLGFVGSSGCSDSPHLHFELLNERGEVVDPFLEDLWENPPIYNVPITLLDYSIHGEQLTDMSQLIDPPENITSISPGKSIIGIGITIMGVKPGDRLKFVLKNGRTINNLERVAGNHGIFLHNQDYTIYGESIRVNKRSGTWNIRVYINNRLFVEHNVRVQ